MSDDGSLKFRSCTVVATGVHLEKSLEFLQKRMRFSSLIKQFRVLRGFCSDGVVVMIFNTGRVTVIARSSHKAKRRAATIIQRLVNRRYATLHDNCGIKVACWFAVGALSSCVCLKSARKHLSQTTNPRYDSKGTRGVLRFWCPELDTRVHVDLFHSGKFTLKGRSKAEIRRAAHVLCNSNLI